MQRPYFRSPECKVKFDNDPAFYMEREMAEKC